MVGYLEGSKPTYSRETPDHHDERDLQQCERLLRYRAKDDKHTQTLVRVHRRKDPSSTEAMSFMRRIEYMAFRIPESCCQVEVNDVDLIASFAQAHDEIPGFHIAVYDRYFVNVLNAGQNLIGKDE